MALEEWQIDAGRSSIGFSVRHMVISKVRGRFTRFRGVLMLDLNDLTVGSARATIDAASIETRDALRDGYLRSGDFLNPEKHPTIEFCSTRVDEIGRRKYKVRGDLTIRGVTREVTLETALAGHEAERERASRIKFAASTKIDRRSFGLEWGAALEAGGFVVGDVVDVALEIEATRSP